MVTFRISWISSTVKAGFEIASVQLPKGGFICQNFAVSVADIMKAICQSIKKAK
ncbi:hypothetical protein ALQ19_200006 [Pseudomonas syringae pv. berberidis]|nr:hypothetical protein ALQ19_200006 [Pseudomonas syringae pv. berberidis]